MHRTIHDICLTTSQIVLDNSVAVEVAFDRLIYNVDSKAAEFVPKQMRVYYDNGGIQWFSVTKTGILSEKREILNAMTLAEIQTALGRSKLVE